LQSGFLVCTTCYMKLEYSTCKFHIVYLHICILVSMLKLLSSFIVVIFAIVRKNKKEEMEMKIDFCGQPLKCHTPRWRVERSMCVVVVAPTNVDYVCNNSISWSMAFFMVILKIPLKPMFLLPNFIFLVVSNCICLLRFVSSLKTFGCNGIMCNV